MKENFIHSALRSKYIKSFAEYYKKISQNWANDTLFDSKYKI